MSLAQREWLPTGSTLSPIDLAVALVELRFQPRHVTEFGRAYRSEILRMREQDRPSIADPLMEVDDALGSLRIEVRNFGVDSQRHDTSPRLSFAMVCWCVSHRPNGCSVSRPKIYSFVSQLRHRCLRS